MVKLSVCPRCGGSMFLYGYPEGWYEECLQCSYSCPTPKMKSRLDNMPNSENSEAVYEKVSKSSRNGKPLGKGEMDPIKL